MDNAFNNGFLVFTLGVLFILTAYHLLLFFQNRQQIYLLYAFYTFFIILSQAGRVSGGFIAEITQPLGPLVQQGELYSETYYILYFFFAFRFLEVSREFPVWNRACMRAVYVLIGFCALKYLAYLITGDYALVGRGYFVFVVYMLVLSIFAYILFFRLKNPLRHYIIIGSLILLVTSYASLLFFGRRLAAGEPLEPALNILYIGFILENLLFSLGLGHKQKLIMEERNESQQKLIAQLEENDRLRLRIQQKLQDDMQTLTRAAEEGKLEAIQARYDKELADLKMASLRSQMNPHFIFNSLNSIKRYIIDNEKEQAVYYLNKFSRLIRMILSTTSRKEVPLSEELDTMRLYLEIENIRFGNELDFDLAVDPGIHTGQVKIPSLLLQPFLENAIWHGLSLKKGSKRIQIRVLREGEEMMVIEVEDNGIGREKAAQVKQKKLIQRESLGLKLTRERLSRFSEAYDKAYSLEFIDLWNPDGQPGGTRVVLKLPLV